MRKLIIIRIVHTPFDMGSAKDGLVKEAIAKMGRQRFEENLSRIEKFWDEVEMEVESIADDPEKLHSLRIYQDGLPVAGELGERIVRETATRGSRNYEIVRKLMDRGARIEATESADLLRQEYGYIKDILHAGSDEEKRAAEARYSQVKDRLLDDRDAFIARSIDSSLKDGETGLLFIGASHNVHEKIPKDIDVKLLD
jgi:hypothetical protein